MSTAPFSLQIPNGDGTVTNLSGTIAIASVSTVGLEPVIPADATVVDMLKVNWAMNHDAGTPGSASGTTSYPANAPDGTPNCRQFQFTLTAGGGFIYHANAMKNSSAFDTFCYETEEYFPDASNLACMEKDLEQADATGAYVDMATQLNGHAGLLDYTSSNPKGWQHTAVKASPMTIKQGWYVTRRYFKNLGGGKVLYIGSYDGGVYSPLSITTVSQPSAKWGANVLNVQYQFDGKSSGSVESTVYARVLRVHCWKS